MRRASWRATVAVACGCMGWILPGSAAAAPEPCKLLTPAQVGTAVGGTFGTGQPIGTTGCSWTQVKPHEIVTLSFWPPKDWERLKVSPLPGVKITPTSGLGDDAFYATLLQYTMLYVKKGQAVFLLKVYGVADQAKQASAEKTLAQNVLQGL